MAVYRCMGCMKEHDDSRGICPYCGYINGTAVSEPYFLLPGTIVDSRFIIGKVLGNGSSTITYIGYDNQNNRKVVIREYMPVQYANRMVGTTDVVPYDGERGDRYEKGLRRFIEEFEQAYELNNSLDGVADIYECFIENNTAYIIMEHVDGVSLEDLVKKTGRINCNDVVQIMLPVLNSIDIIHSQGCFYYDITPDTIVMTRDRKVKLIGMGVKNNEGYAGNNQNSMKKGFSAEELYRKNGSVGAWTDLYAIAATIYYAITGVIPQDSLERKENDRLTDPSVMGVKITKHKENALMNALNIYMEDRTKSVKIFAEALSGQRRTDRIIVTKKKEDTGKWNRKTKVLVTSFVAVALVLVGLIALIFGLKEFSSKKKEMVNITGLTETEATKELDEIGMKYYIIGRVESDKPNGVILYQEFQPGSKIAADETIVNVKISSGKTQKGIMPSLKGLTQEEALKTLEEMSEGYNISYKFEEKETDKVKEGLVTKQSVKAGKEFEDINEEIVISIAKNVEETSSTTKSESHEEYDEPEISKTPESTEISKSTQASEPTETSKNKVPKRTTTTKAPQTTTKAPQTTTKAKAPTTPGRRDEVQNG